MRRFELHEKQDFYPGALPEAQRIKTPFLSSSCPTTSPKGSLTLPRCTPVRNQSPLIAFNGSHGEWLRTPHQSLSSSLRAHPGMSRNAPFAS